MVWHLTSHRSQLGLDTAGYILTEAMHHTTTSDLAVVTRDEDAKGFTIA